MKSRREKEIENENKIAPLWLKNAELNLDTFDKLKKFADYANTPNPANAKIREMIKESSPIPRKYKNK